MVFGANSDQCNGGWLQEPGPDVRSILRPHDDSTAINRFVDRSANRPVLPAATAASAIRAVAGGRCPATNPTPRSADGIIGKHAAIASGATTRHTAVGARSEDGTGGHVELLGAKAVVDRPFLVNYPTGVFDCVTLVAGTTVIVDRPAILVAIGGSTRSRYDDVHTAKFELQLCWIDRPGSRTVHGHIAGRPNAWASHGRARQSRKHSRRGPHAQTG